MAFVTVSHFTEADVPVRTALLHESRFQANLTDFAVATSDDALVTGQLRTIAEEHDVKRILTMRDRRGDIVGFAWITSIDWRSRTCELSFGLLPRYRGGYGVAAVAAANEYLREELNVRAIVNQVLDHNTMLLSARTQAAQRRVLSPYDSYTVGEWRAAGYWSDTEETVRAQQDEAEDRRRALADRVRALTQRTA
jgi:hypothetical protein